jgi:hypothetical protein
LACFGFLFVLLLPAGGEAAPVSFVIHSQATVSLEIKGYNGLTETTVFKGSLSAGEQQEIETSYQGLALLCFDKGQQYPIILGGQPFILRITGPDNPPLFTGSTENEFFYTLLTGQKPGTGHFGFPLLMVEAKQLLESSHSIRTVSELAAMKEKFHRFVRTNYQYLQHTDMLRRLISQYFMMHEYVDFHVKGALAGDIQEQYRKAVIGGVENWIKILKPHIPEPEVLNYCVSLYYNRSMVTLAHLIVRSLSDYAYCPGNILKNIQVSEDVSVFDAEGNNKGVVKNFSGNGILAFVSADCPVSMVETVIRARKAAGQGKNRVVIVVPVQKISDKHWAMRRMLTSGNMFFVKDEKWRVINTAEDIRLPLFVDIAASKP